MSACNSRPYHGLPPGCGDVCNLFDHLPAPLQRALWAQSLPQVCEGSVPANEWGKAVPHLPQPPSRLTGGHQDQPHPGANDWVPAHNEPCPWHPLYLSPPLLCTAPPPPAPPRPRPHVTFSSLDGWCAPCPQTGSSRSYYYPYGRTDSSIHGC